MTKQDRDSSPHHGSGGKGSNSKIAINTLKMLYLMCVQYREGGSYNNYPIDDILVDKYNLINTEKMVLSVIESLHALFGNMILIRIVFL